MMATTLQLSHHWKEDLRRRPKKKRSEVDLGKNCDKILLQTSSGETVIMRKTYVVVQFQCYLQPLGGGGNGGCPAEKKDHVISSLALVHYVIDPTILQL